MRQPKQGAGEVKPEGIRKVKVAAGRLQSVR